jgi:putative Mn2+ efflux pump MntP
MIEIIFLAVALSMDAFAISIGLKSKEKSIWSDSIDFTSEPKKTPSLT